MIFPVAFEYRGGILFIHAHDSEAILDHYAKKQVCFQDGKTGGIERKIREVLGQALWEDLTVDERWEEVCASIRADLEVAGEECGEDWYGYVKRRAGDFLDPMSEVYKLFLR